MTRTYDDTARCWAFGPTGQRCESAAGHDDDHTVSTSWTDDECVTPEHFAMARVIGQTTTERPVPIVGVTSFNTPAPAAWVDEDTTPPGRCFTCNCSEAAHEPDGCVPHSCKTYLP